MTKRWREDCMELGAIADEATLIKKGLEMGRSLGFERCYLWLDMGATPTKIDAEVFGSEQFPAHWHDRYKNDTIRAANPIYMHARTTLLPVDWSEPHIANATAFWDEVGDVVHRHGYARPTKWHGNSFCILNFSRAHDPMKEKERAELAKKSALLSVALHGRIIKLRAAASLADEPLDDRDRDILRWAADGKRAKDIAEITGKPQRTIEYHWMIAIQKMGAVSIAQAVAKAMAAGELTLI